MSSYEAIKTAVSAAKRVLVITHVAPDGDAIGSLTAVGLALDQLGKEAVLACDDRIPERYQFLAKADAVQTAVSGNPAYDLIFAVDCGDESRMGKVFEKLPRPLPPVVNVDHHVTNTRFGQMNLVDGEATATAEVLCDLLPELGVRLTRELAVSLLTGIVTDTLGFRTVGVTAHTLKVAGRLIEAGADLPQVTMMALTVKPLSTILLWRAGLNNMKLEDGLLWTTISKREREATGYSTASSAGLVNLLGDTTEAAIASVLMEMDDGKVYVGFRCRPPYTVSELALSLGGVGTTWPPVAPWTAPWQTRRPWW
ncbi:MAG: bifunctional oligoribonuclease/PAP phosphatase NrnA [Chloroflexota bacterium]